MIKIWLNSVELALTEFGWVDPDWNLTEFRQFGQIWLGRPRQNSFEFDLVGLDRNLIELDEFNHYVFIFLFFQGVLKL